MKKILFGLIALLATPAFASPEIGKPAPDFATVDVAGRTFKLADQKGRIVVLEWYNPGCPFTRAHYDSGNMQALQKYAAEKGVVWASIDSSAEGKEGFLNKEEAGKQLKKEKSGAAHLLLDPYGDLGKKYEAKTTPHMFVIDRDGNLAYMGAIDDKGGARAEEIKSANNYVKAAIDAVLEGKSLETQVTKPYGCSIKYKD